MNGWEALRNELHERGYNKSQINIKIVAEVVSILSENMAFVDTYMAERECKSKQKELSSIERDIHIAQGYLKGLEEEIKNIREEEEKIRSDYKYAMTDAQKEIESYLLELNKAIEEAETPESRDLLRKTQMFVNSVDVDTKYDNTAFIIGLSAILTEGAIQPVEELKKINKKLFNSPVPSEQKEKYQSEESDWLEIRRHWGSKGRYPAKEASIE